MNTESLFTSLHNERITLSLDNGQLFIDGPEDVIQKFIHEVREHKAELADYLIKRQTLPEGKKAMTIIRHEDGLLDMENHIYKKAIRKVFMDTETTGLDPFSSELVLIQVMAGNRIFMIDVSAIPQDQCKTLAYGGLKRILEDVNILKIFHNGLFDMKFIRYHIFGGSDIHFNSLFDTMLAEQLLTAGISQRGDHSLVALCRKYLGIELDKSLQTSFVAGESFSDDQIRYASDDVKHLEPIFKIQSAAIAKAELQEIALLEFAITPAIANIELAGVRIDTEKLEVIKARLLKEELQINEKLHDIITAAGIMDKHPSLFKGGADMNYRSPVQVKQVLNAFGFNVEGTGIKILAKINHPFTKTLVEYRKITKLLTSFVGKMPKHINKKTGRVHPQFFQLGTEAGRFTCQNPNVQQMPRDKEWRNLFSAPDGFKIITADYSQIELRILAEYSQDEAFLSAYRTGQDLHSRTAAEMFNLPINDVTKQQRGIAKIINFGLCYGMGAKGLSMGLNISIEKAESFISSYFRTYPKVKNTLQMLGKKAVENLYTVTLGGRKRYFPAPDSFASQQSLERQGRNTPIQGTCGDILKKAILYLSESLVGYQAQIVNLVHDEIVIEAREDQAEAVREIVSRDMIRAGQDYIKSIPVEVEVTVNDVWSK